MRIFIAGPYWSEDPEKRLRNTNDAIDVGLRIFKKGHAPYIPHLFHFADAYAKSEGITMSEADYRAIDLEWLRTCQGIYVLGISDGVNREIAEAEYLGIKRFNYVMDIPKEAPL